MLRFGSRVELDEYLEKADKVTKLDFELKGNKIHLLEGDEKNT